MAKLEAGEVRTADLEAVPMDEIVQASLAHCKTRAVRASGEHCRSVDELPAVRADLERAKEAMVQLIDNANLYSPKDQPITITAELTGDYVTTSVADRGPGIDDFDQTMIFEKFYRGKDQRYLVRGTGMGLPIAKAIGGGARRNDQRDQPARSRLGVFVHVAGGSSTGGARMWNVARRALAGEPEQIREEMR